MRHSKSFAFALVFLAALTCQAQDQRQVVSSLTVQQPQPTALPFQRIGPEDLIGLQIYDAPEFTRSIRVASDGTIRLPMLKEPIRVQGLLPNEVEALISDALQREKIFVDPFVTINVLEYKSRPISVNGSVRVPVIFQAIGTVTLLDAIARAGGLTEMAGPEIVVTRPNGDTGEQSVQRIPAKPLIAGTDPQLNIKLVGGEEIRVPEVGKVVVWGNVNRSGVFPVLDSASMTVGTAIAQAQGLQRFYSHEAYIYRSDDQGVKHEIKVELNDILHRKAPDVALQARDILYVPDSPGRRLTSTTLDRLAGFATGAASTLIYIAEQPH